MTQTRKIVIILSLAALTLLIVWILIVRGTEEPLADASRMQTANCERPCWRGIQPGITTLDEAEAILRDDDTLEITQEDDQICGQSSNPFSRICADAQAGTVTRLNWILPASGHERVFLADAVAAFGEPTAAKLCNRVDTWHSVVNFNGNVIVVAYGGSTLMNEPRRFASDQRVEQVLYYTADNVPPIYAQEAPAWSGYGEVSAHPTCQI